MWLVKKELATTELFKAGVLEAFLQKNMVKIDF
jgi:hypothetical protein